MGSHTESSLTSLVVWSDETRNLKELAKSKSALPGLYKIVRGHYRNVGSERGQQRIVAIHSVESSQKILAETLKISGSKASRSDQKFSVPLTYQGWFEVLSEDGKSISTLSSVKDIAKALPHYCLVREDFKAPISDGGIDDKITVDKTRIVRAGEKLTLKNDILASVKTEKGPVNKRYLRCHDEQGKNVFLSFQEDISLSPIAGQNNISGVHSVRGLLDRFRLPVTVRLAHGNVSAKLDKNWSSVFRLISTYSEEVAFVLPVKKDATMLAIPTRESLQFVSAKNVDKVKDTAEFQIHMDKCGSFIKAHLNSIQSLSSLPDPEDIMQKKKTVRSRVGPKIGSDGDDIDEEEEELLFEEIEEIYRYVRDGGDPPAPKTRPSKSEAKNDVEGEIVEPTSNYAYINDLKKASPTAVGTVTTAAENDVKSSNKADEIIEDYTDEPLYADITKIQERKRQRDSEVKLPEQKVDNENDIGVSQQTIKPSAVEKVTSSAEDRVKTLANGVIAPVAEVAPLPVTAIAAAALTSDEKRIENIQSSPVQILRNKKPGPPTPQRASQIIPLNAGTIGGTLLPSDDKTKLNNVMANIPESKPITNFSAEKPDENFRVAKLTSLFKRDTSDKVEEKSPVDLSASAQTVNPARNSMFNNNAAKSVAKPENQQKSTVEPPKVSSSNGLNAIAKEKEAEIRNSAKIPPPITAAISRDFQVNKQIDLKKDLGFTEPIKPVVAQPVRSANYLIKSEATKPAVSVENKVKEVRKDISDNVQKDFAKVSNKIENTRKEVVSRSFEPVGNDKTRVASSRVENISNDIVNKVTPVAPLHTDTPNNRQNLQRKIVETAVVANPVQEIKKEVTSHVNRVSNSPQIPVERRNSFAPVTNIQKEVPRQDIPQISNAHKVPEIGAHGVTVPRLSVANIPAPPFTSLPAIKDEIGQLNQDLNIPVVPQVALLNHATPIVVDRPPQAQPASISYSNPIAVDKSAPSLRVGNDLTPPTPSITVVEPQPQNYQYRPPKEIIPTMVTIGEGVADPGHLPVGWRDDEHRTYQPPARSSDGVGSTAVNISNGIAAPIERSVLQLSSSNSFNHIESSIVHTSGFDRLMQEEELNRRNTLHMDTQAPGKSYQPVNAENRNPTGYSSQGSSSGSSTGITVYPDRTVLSVSNPNNIGYKSPGYATIKSNGNMSNGSFSGSSTMRRLNSNTSDPNSGVSITTVHMTSNKTPDQGYKVQESRPAMNQQGPGSGHTILRISQQPGSSGSPRSGTTYAVNVATLHRVK